jgi:hypothetical protein
METPWFKNKEQPQKGQDEGRSLKSMNSLSQERAGKEDEPERHHIDQNGSLARSSIFESPKGAPHEAGRLKEAQGQDEPNGRKDQRTMDESQDQKQDKCSPQDSHCGKQEGGGMGQGSFHHHPVVPPDQGKKEKRKVRKKGRVSHELLGPNLIY